MKEGTEGMGSGRQRKRTAVGIALLLNDLRLKEL